MGMCVGIDNKTNFSFNDMFIVNVVRLTFNSV